MAGPYRAVQRGPSLGEPLWQRGSHWLVLFAREAQPNLVLFGHLIRRLGSQDGAATSGKGLFNVRDSALSVRAPSVALRIQAIGFHRPEHPENGMLGNHARLAKPASPGSPPP